jgi:SAM-dependent methyltransferase
MSQTLDTSRKLAVPLTRLMNRWLLPIMPLLPLPHRVLHGLFVRDNNTEQAANGWARLRDVSELGRYSVIQGFVHHYAAQGSILDVGCGDGILQERLSYDRYLGIELFQEAVQRAAVRGDARTRFMQADAATFAPEEKFDAIVWNECLYYLKNPVEAVERYLGYLRPNGVVIVSMFYQTYATRRLFRQLDQRAARVASVRLINDEGTSWLVNAYQPRMPLLADAR